MTALTGSPPPRLASGLIDWLHERRAACSMRVEPIPHRASRQWRLEDGRLRHATGGFFSVIGVQTLVNDQHVMRLDQPLIDQPEIGILGFIVRRAVDGPQILVQAKPEPGNVGLLQAAPTVQATESNYRRKHRGKPTPFLGHFTGEARARILADARQSEQGTRFLGKFNRNVMVEVHDHSAAVDEALFRWTPVRELLPLLIDDFQINTDARSVLACGDWWYLAGDERPFARCQGRGGFGEELLRSHQAGNEAAILATDDAQRLLAEHQQRCAFRARVVPLSDLHGWHMSDDAIRSGAGGSFEVRHYGVHTTQREVTDWDQPLVACDSVGEAALLCQRRRGVLHFLFRARPEIGFTCGYELGPTIQDLGDSTCLDASFAAREAELLALANGGETMLACRHSDEGGRFFRCVSSYRVIMLADDERIAPAPEQAWLTLAQVQTLLKRTGVFSNEARSLVSMLLAYL